MEVLVLVAEKIIVKKIVFVARWCLVGWILLFRMIFMVVKVQKMLNMVVEVVLNLLYILTYLVLKKLK